MWFSSLSSFIPRSGAYVSYGLHTPVAANISSSASRYGASTSYSSKHTPLPYKYDTDHSSRHPSRSSRSSRSKYYYCTSPLPSTYERTTDTITTAVYDTYGLYVSPMPESRYRHGSSPSSSSSSTPLSGSLSSTSTLGKHVRFASDPYDDHKDPVYYRSSSSRYGDINSRYREAASSAFRKEERYSRYKVRHSRSPRTTSGRPSPYSDHGPYNDRYSYDRKRDHDYHDHDYLHNDYHYTRDSCGGGDPPSFDDRSFEEVLRRARNRPYQE